MQAEELTEVQKCYNQIIAFLSNKRSDWANRLIADLVWLIDCLELSPDENDHRRRAKEALLQFTQKCPISSPEDVELFQKVKNIVSGLASYFIPSERQNLRMLLLGSPF